MENNLLEALQEKYGDEYTIRPTLPQSIIDAISDSYHYQICKIEDYKEMVNKAFQDYTDIKHNYEVLVTKLNEMEKYMIDNDIVKKK